MAIVWKGPGCLLLNGKRFVNRGQIVPEGALTQERIEVFRKEGLVDVSVPSVARISVASPIPVSVPVTVPIFPSGKRGTERGSKAGPR